LGIVLLASYDLFFAIKWIGAAYLVWLGVIAMVAKPSAPAVVPQARPLGALRLFCHCVLLQLANPKSLLFFTALLPQFINWSEPADVPMPNPVQRLEMLFPDFPPAVIAAHVSAVRPLNPGYDSRIKLTDARSLCPLPCGSRAWPSPRPPWRAGKWRGHATRFF